MSKPMEVNDDSFAEYLRLTQQYCTVQLLNSHKSEAEVLRSIGAEFGGVPLFVFETTDHTRVNWSVDPWENDYSILSELFEKQLAVKKNYVYTSDDRLTTQGRVLACELATVTDGASESESKGIIDIYDLPPIDTWVFLSDGREAKILYAWIPEQYFTLVQDAIDVNMLGLLRWDGDED